MKAVVVALLLMAPALAGCVGPAGIGESTDARLPASWELGLARPLQLLGSAATEPTVAVRPGSAGAVVVVVSREIFQSRDAGHGEWTEKVVHRTVDGGNSWESSRLPRTVLAPFDGAGNMDTGGDPSLAYAPDGTLYLAGTTAKYSDQSTPSEDVGLLVHDRNSIFVTASHDDGHTWGPALYWQQGAMQAILKPVPVPVRTGYIQDRPWIDVGPDGTIHLAWIRWNAPTNPELRYNGLLYASSMDQGKTWSPPLLVATTGPETENPDSFLHGTNVGADANGTIYVSATRFPMAATSERMTEGGRHLVWRSFNGGASFGGPLEVGPGSWMRWGSLAVDQSVAARLLFAGIDDHASGRAYWAESLDAGMHWTKPAFFDGGQAGPQWNPAVWIDSEGRAIITYYETMDSGEERLAVRVVEGSGVAFEGVPEGEPGRPGRLRADYMGLDGDGDAAWVAWVGGTQTGSREGTRLEIARLRLAEAAG